MIYGTAFANTEIVASDDPAVFLKQPPSPEGQLLVSQADKHSGQAVTWWEFSELAVRQHRNSRWIDGLEDFFKKVRRHARAAVGALLFNLVAIGGFALHRASEDGAARERTVQLEQRALERRDSMQREIEGLRRQISELRADLRRLSGIDAPKVDGVEDAYGEPEGKFSNLEGWSSILASGLSPPRPTPNTSCGRTCLSSIECTSLVPTCKFCNFGECKATRPERIPIPVDAGVPDSGMPAGAQ